MSDYTRQLQSVFEEYIKLQETQPQYKHSIEIQNPTDEFQEGVHCYFFSNVGRILTNRPQIGIGFKFSSAQEEKFKKLHIFSEFEINNDDISATCYDITIANDAIKAASIFNDIVKNVFEPRTMPNIKTSTNIIHRYDKKFLNSYLSNHLPLMFCFDLPQSTNMTVITSQYTKTKSVIEKYGFGKVELFDKEKCVKGYYQPTEEPTGFFASIKHGGKMGDCEGELTRLLSLCYDLFK